MTYNPEIVKKLTPAQKILRRRILEILFNGQMSHISSCLSSCDLIDGVYQIKKPKDKFVLSNGQAAVALYAVLEKHHLLQNPSLTTLNVHPDRNPKNHIDVSTGSLGQGLPIALGMALANPQINVYCLISDGECTEGSIWEALRVKNDLLVKNLVVIVTANGWGAYDPISGSSLKRRIKGFGFKTIDIDGHHLGQIQDSLTKTIQQNNSIIFAQTSSDQFPFLNNLDSHYYIMNDQDFKLVDNLLK